MMKVSDPIMFGHAVEVYFKVRRPSPSPRNFGRAQFGRAIL